MSYKTKKLYFTYCFSNYLKVKIDSDYDLSLEKTLPMLLSHIY